MTLNICKQKCDIIYVLRRALCLQFGEWIVVERKSGSRTPRENAAILRAWVVTAPRRVGVVGMGRCE